MPIQLPSIPGWVKNVCYEAGCGMCAVLLSGAFGFNLYSEKEIEQIESLKKLTELLLSKSETFSNDPTICKKIEKYSFTALKEGLKNVPSETVAAVVCEYAFGQRMRSILMGACMNLVGCSS